MVPFPERRWQGEELDVCTCESRVWAGGLGLHFQVDITIASSIVMFSARGHELTSWAPALCNLKSRIRQQHFLGRNSFHILR